MKPKQVITALLLAFVAASVIFLLVKETRSKTGKPNTEGQAALAQEPAPTGPAIATRAAANSPQENLEIDKAPPAPSAARAKTQPSMPDRTVVAYYFHGSFRCQTCRKIEALSREAVESGFPEDLKAGRLKWRVINVEEPENEHFVKDYQLFSKSLVLVAKEGSKQTRWKDLQKVWTLVGDKEAFTKYVQEEIRVYIRGA